MTSDTMYPQNTASTVNGLNAYDLFATVSGGNATFDTGWWDLFDWYGASGIRVWKRTSAGTETEITSGTPVAICYIDVDGSPAYKWAPWDCPSTALNSTDCIVVRFYGYVDGWHLYTTFHTDQLGATNLDSATWTVRHSFMGLVAGDTGINYLYIKNTTTTTKIADFTYTLASSLKQSGSIIPLMEGMGMI